MCVFGGKVDVGKQRLNTPSAFECPDLRKDNTMYYYCLVKSNDWHWRIAVQFIDEEVSCEPWWKSL